MLDSSYARELRCHKLVVEEPRASSHPLYLVSSYDTTVTRCILMLDLTRVDDRDRLESAMWVESDSRTMIALRSDLPWSIVVEHEEWTRLIAHLTTVTRDILHHTESVSDHMCATRMFYLDYIFLHRLILCELNEKATLFYKV